MKDKDIYMAIQWSGKDFSSGKAFYLKLSEWHMMKGELDKDDKDAKFKYVLYSEKPNDEFNYDIFYSDYDVQY